MDQPYHSMTDAVPLQSYQTEECREEVDSLDDEDLMVSCESLKHNDWDHIQQQIQDMLNEVRDIKQSIYRIEQNKHRCTLM